MKEQKKYSKITANLHTHTYLCQHAVGDVNDYCKEAIDKKLNILGISDHTPLPDNRWQNERMDLAELLTYCQSIEQAREEFPELIILKAMECEYADEYASFYRDELLGRLQFDYLIGAVHYFPHNGEWFDLYNNSLDAPTLTSYAKYFIDSMKSDLFLFMAHPDIFGYAYFNWDANAKACSRDILEAASALKVPLEINGNGFRKPMIKTLDGMRLKYPWEKFWEMASKYEIEVVANSDAHKPKDVVGNIQDAIAIGEKYNLKFSKLVEKSILS